MPDPERPRPWPTIAIKLAARRRIVYGRRLWEHVFAMTSDGHVYARFQRALTNGHLLQAMSEARDLPHVPLADALALCLLMERHDDERYARSAARYPVVD